MRHRVLAGTVTVWHRAAPKQRWHDTCPPAACREYEAGGSGWRRRTLSFDRRTRNALAAVMKEHAQGVEVDAAAEEREARLHQLRGLLG